MIEVGEITRLLQHDYEAGVGSEWMKSVAFWLIMSYDMTIKCKACNFKVRLIFLPETKAPSFCPMCGKQKLQRA
jgi:predicted RNA-binding Zn-ribbon protein involved in translation (DUF1610 family)